MLHKFKKRYCFNKFHFIIFTIIIIVFTYYFGITTHFLEIDYDTDFSYPLHRNVVSCAIALENKENVECPFINFYNYSFIIKNDDKCRNCGIIQLVLIIKSAVNNSNRRSAIRNSWGFESRFSDVIIKRVFVLGVLENDNLLDNIKKEQENYGDIVQANFQDTYFNNTIKTMISFKWAIENCANSKFYLFSDDDMYISIKNVLRFLRNPTEYPQYLQKSENVAVSNFINTKQIYELPQNVKLFTGFVFQSTAPHRHQCSKWYVSLKEYPYNKWPPYVSAGSYILSSEALKLIYYVSFFTKNFRFDDIYLGIVAKKAHIEPFHCSEFHIFQKPYNIQNFKYVLSSHGYHSEKLLKIWNEQKVMGNA